MTQEYTPDGLPAVRKELVRTYIAELTKMETMSIEDCRRKIMQLGERMQKENKAYYACAEALRRIWAISEGESVLFMLGFTHAYELLRRQAEANKLEKTTQ